MSMLFIRILALSIALIGFSIYVSSFFSIAPREQFFAGLSICFFGAAVTSIAMAVRKNEDNYLNLALVVCILPYLMHIFYWLYYALIADPNLL